MTFIGDRFIHVGPHWLDIVTGRAAVVRAGPAPADLAARQRLCEARWRLVEPEARLIDFGPQGSMGWFEAASVAAGATSLRMRQLMWPQARGIADAIEDAGAPAHLGIAAPPGAGFTVLCGQLARLARDAGFVTVGADAPIPFRLRRLLLHRHLVLLVTSEAARAFAAGWLAQLALVSDRRHVVVARCAEPASGVVSLRPFDREQLIDAVTDAGMHSDAAIRGAAIESGGWPAAFVRRLAAQVPRMPVTSGANAAGVANVATHENAATIANVARERSLAFGMPAVAVERDLARAETYARRRRPMAEAAWHAAAVAAAARRGDEAGRVQLTARWVDRLIDTGRFRRAVEVATRAMAEVKAPAPDGSGDTSAQVALTILAARAHLAAAEVTRADTLARSAVALDRLRGEVSIPAVAVQLEIMFWQGRWREMRSELDLRPAFPERERWLAFVDWADRGATMPLPSGASAYDARWFRPTPHAGRGLCHAIAIAVRMSLGRTDEGERRWLDDLVRRERLRGLARFGQGRSKMQMLRDMATLLEIVQSSEDEVDALARVCGWIRTACGGGAAAVVDASGTVIAGEALRAFGADVDVRAPARWCDVSEPGVECADVRALAHAPVRFGGATLGAIAAAGPAACEGALLDAVAAAAAVCGALVRARLDAIAAAAQGDALAGDILGTSPAIRGVRAAVARTAIAPFPVVIEGESGTGKELVARALHRQSLRRDRAFAALNCAALTDELIEAELFGHARGAFTHAVNARTGLFEDAHHGTLFLDEVGELSPRAQAKLLRAIQEGEIRRIGENESRAVDVRVIAATNRPLSQLAAEGRFREDLMFRLSVVKIAVPPLRERSEDVPQLAVEFWRAAARRVGTRATLGPDALGWLTHLPWPGNVRQLQNAMAALSVAAPKTGRVSARLVRLVLDGIADVAPADVVSLEEARRQVERRVVAAALARHTGSRTEAARALGLSRQGLSKALKRLGLAEAGAA